MNANVGGVLLLYPLPPFTTVIPATDVGMVATNGVLAGNHADGPTTKL